MHPKSPEHKAPLPSCHGFLTAWAILTIFHFALYHAVVFTRFGAHVYREFERVGQPFPARNDVERTKWSLFGVAAPYIERVQKDVSFAVSLPLLPIISRPKSYNVSYYELSIPLSFKCLNSALAAGILYFFGFVITCKCSRQNRWRRFFAGEARLEEGQLPRPVERMPMIASLRFLKAAETNNAKQIVVYGIIHFLLTTLTRRLEIIDNLSGKKSIFSLIAKIMRFPVEPLIVHHLANQANQAAAGILLVANSAFIAITVGFILQARSVNGRNRRE